MKRKVRLYDLADNIDGIGRIVLTSLFVWWIWSNVQDPFNQGEIAYHKKEYQESVRYLNEFLDDSGDSCEVAEMLGLSHLALENRYKATEFLIYSINQCYPSREELDYLTNQIKDITDDSNRLSFDIILHELASKSQESQTYFTVVQAIEKYSTGNYESALQFLKTAEERNADGIMFHECLALTLYKTGQYELAVEALTELIISDSIQSLVIEKMLTEDSTLSDLSNQIIRLNGTNTEPYSIPQYLALDAPDYRYLRGKCYQNIGELENALNDYETLSMEYHDYSEDYDEVRRIDSLIFNIRHLISRDTNSNLNDEKEY